MNIIKVIVKKIIYADVVYRSYEILSYFFKYSRIPEKERKKGELKLHLGCGNEILDSWINIDMSLNPRVLSIKLPKGLERFDDGSVRYIYTSHFLEHLEYPNVALDFVKECHRILVVGGALRIVVPEIEIIIRAYVHDDQAFFEDQATMHPSWCTTKLEHLMYALQQDGQHKYGYDFETVEKLLSEAGFSKIVKSDYNRSQVEDLKIDYRAETDSRNGRLSLYVDAIK